MKEQEIIERLDAIIHLLMPTFDEKMFGFKGIPIEVLKLCDYNHTVQNMTKKLRKSRPVIDNALSKLRKDGLIKSVNRNNQIVYVRLK